MKKIFLCSLTFVRKALLPNRWECIGTVRGLARTHGIGRRHQAFYLEPNNILVCIVKLKRFVLSFTNNLLYNSI